MKNLMQTINKEMAVFRAMPNTAIAIQASMTSIAYNSSSDESKNLVLSLFDQLGKIIIIDEQVMEFATVLGACGIAYAFRFIRAASQGVIEIGFDTAKAQTISAQTAKGAAAFLIENGNHPEKEIDKVTAPKGCTIADLNEFEHNGFSSALIKDIITSFKKIGSM